MIRGRSWVINWFKELKAGRPHPRNYSTHRQTPWTDYDSSLPFSALGKAEPLRSNGSAVRAQTDGRTDRRYQFYYLPRFAVDNKHIWSFFYGTLMYVFVNPSFFTNFQWFSVSIMFGGGGVGGSQNNVAIDFGRKILGYCTLQSCHNTMVHYKRTNVP